jgi:hypothetical protein
LQNYGALGLDIQSKITLPLNEIFSQNDSYHDWGNLMR